MLHVHNNHIILCLYIDVSVEALVNEQNVFQGLYFQDHQMKSIFSAYPELLCVDATLKLLDLRLPLYIMLVEDLNGQSEVAAAFY